MKDRSPESTRAAQDQGGSHPAYQFLATASHEFRNALGIILGYTQLLLEGEEGHMDADARVLLERIFRSAKYLLTLNNDLLDFSRIELGAMSLARQSVDVSTLLTRVAEAMPLLLKGSPVRFTLGLAPELGKLETDPVRLEQILLNLLGNATKFTPCGEITLSASRQHEADESWVEIVIADTGIGFSTETQALLFNEFYQLEPAPTNRQKGVGLGLAICKKLIELLGGRISVESAVGKGSTFRLRLPASESPA